MISARDRRLVLAMIGVLLAQTITGLVWAGGAAARLDYLETEITRSHLLSERTARLETQSNHILESLARIESKIDERRGEQ
jgi:hypothetical protein